MTTNTTNADILIIDDETGILDLGGAKITITLPLTTTSTTP